MYVIGIDGGGTKTKAIIMNETGEVMGMGVSGPSSIDTVSMEKAYENILIAINEAKKNIEKFCVSSIFVGLGGIVTDSDANIVINYLRRNLSLINETTIIDVKNDVFNALSAGLPLDNEGIIIIIGTGSVAFGIKDGKTHRAGGYGFHEGEPGSSYDLGRQIIRLCSRSLDGRLEKSSLIDEVKNDFSITNAEEFTVWIKELFYNRTKTAFLAQYVTKHARLGDKYALEIIDDATEELVMMIKAVQLTLHISNKKVAVAGSLGNDKTYFEIFVSKVKKLDSSYSVLPCILDPVIGAGIAALKQSGVIVSNDTINMLKEV